MISYVEVAVNVSWNDRSLTYLLPDDVTGISPGVRVVVEVGNEEVEGIVLESHNNEPNYKVKKIIKVIDSSPVITKEQIELGDWMSESYLSSLGEALFKMLPRGKRKIKTHRSDLIIRHENLQQLNDEQKLAFESILRSGPEEIVHLLFGITGSGKTEVYIHLMKHYLENTDGSILFLVPEISLTFPTVQRIERIFPGEIAILHSHLRTSEKFQNYTDVLEGKKRIVIGTRSAVFAPLKNIDLIIIDEEHDGSYKENSNPRYHARQVALQRIKERSGKLVMGSATPSLEIFFQAKQGRIGFHKLTKRANPNATLAKIEIGKMKDDHQLVSGDLQFRIQDRLKKKEQTLILLNRRGYSPLIHSKSKNEFLPCPKCTSSLCYHNQGLVMCHLCGYKISFKQLQAEEGEIELVGAGTQKLEETLVSIFPQAKVERLDQDSTRNKDIVKEVLERLESKELDILTGTQMVAKGLDFPNVTLVGILNANHGLGVPDFRSAERTFSLLAQVAGRAGRGDIPGEVFIQATDPTHPVIQMALRQNYEEFYEWEIAFRHSLRYPPFSRLARLVFRSKDEDRSAKLSVHYKEVLVHLIEEGDGIDILGPSPCPFYKIDNNFRHHILIKSKTIQKIREVLKTLKEQVKQDIRCYVEYDFDPVDLV
ncbi:primosomal protein N' [Leptospira kobayashii]|uniref:Replication restart protein PriA n=1 Tax=Leptospira kobayashii TaxID=1917830 RepID=A0ABN6KH73_9LEPT|nr:primosomal protein N' [Leptospira kobayashii]BDA78927.1 primosomal protein N' [Leptospira kobayashii]